ncbi:lysozyme [Stenotrophomonas sp. CW117]|uniref:glycoside hydrolase family protein n=1 Tax=Stenotrophomonas TaxID=40323 RepID=UPI00177EEAF3|nr:lysozyme [Stenotrophomonas sp. CW117]QOF99798.1 lysozyme [Stenotrophomonas sp. CW117]
MPERQPTGGPVRVAVTALALSIAAFAGWVASEGDGPTAVRADGEVVHQPYIPTKGDVPTIGHGSTRYEDGTPVRMTDAPITRARATELARNLHSEEEARFKASLPGVALTQGEFGVYLDFTGQYGIGNWRGSSMRRELLITPGLPAAAAAPHYRKACDALLLYRRQGGRDCSLPQNWGPKGCKGVWTRQQARHAKCLAEQVAQ